MKGGHVEVVQALLKKAADVDIGGIVSVQLSSFLAFDFILSPRNASSCVFCDELCFSNNYLKDNKTALYWAVEKGHLAILKLLLDYNASKEIPNKVCGLRNKRLWSCDQVAFCCCDLSCCVSCRHQDGDTPLMKAVRGRNTEIVERLVLHGAKVSAVDKVSSLLKICSVWKSTSCTWCLNCFVTALNCAEVKENFVASQCPTGKYINGVLLQKGDTPLHIAVRGRSKRITEILLRNPKDSRLLYKPNKAGETPYHMDASHHKSILSQIFGARKCCGRFPARRLPHCYQALALILFHPRIGHLSTVLCQLCLRPPPPLPIVLSKSWTCHFCPILRLT